MKPFVPFPLLGNPHLQTILSSYMKPFKEPLSKTYYVKLSDGDTLALEISTPVAWREDKPTVLMIHGLAGSHQSSYLRRLNHKFFYHGLRVIRINLRGSGSGAGLAKKAYHAGVSFDIFEVLEHLKEKTPLSPFTLIGFSLGGNVVLKLAGEKKGLKTYLKKVIAICPAISLRETSLSFCHWPNSLYERKFLNYLNKIAHSHAQCFSTDLKKQISKCRSLYEFDDKFTAPFWGYRDADDYYAQCSAKPLVPQIELPCQILFAEDDPLINAHALDHTVLPPHIEVQITKQGGHMGFLGHPKHSTYRWMDERVFEWTTQTI